MILNTYIKAVSTAVSSVGAKLMKTGQTTSYQTDDDGDKQRGRATNWYNLASNNPFGHVKRFTGTTGGYYDEISAGYKDVTGAGTTLPLAFPNDIMIDWSTFSNGTVLAWRYSINGGNINWSDSVSACPTLTIGGLATWHLPNIVELDSLRNYSISNHLGWLPINQANALWTSTTNAASTTQAFHRNGVANASAAKTSSSNLRYIPCRLCTVTGTTLS